jgi:hypothetical protein
MQGLVIQFHPKDSPSTIFTKIYVVDDGNVIFPNPFLDSAEAGSILQAQLHYREAMRKALKGEVVTTKVAAIEIPSDIYDKGNKVIAALEAYKESPEDTKQQAGIALTDALVAFQSCNEQLDELVANAKNEC